MKIIAKVLMNGEHALVLDKIDDFVYKRLGKNIIYGTNGLGYICYKYETPNKYSKAFGGREFDLTMEDGEVVHCNGQWWDDGHKTLEKELGIKFSSVAYNTIEDLKKCYVYYGCLCDMDKIESIQDESNGCVFPYHDYDKVLKYSGLQSKLFKLEKELENLKDK